MNRASRVVVLGGYGLAGQAIVAGLLRGTELDIVLVGRDLERARAAARAAPGSNARVTAARGDAGNAGDIARLLHTGDILVVAASTPLALPALASAAVERSADYLDLWYSPKVARAMRAALAAPDRCVVTQAGLQPGLPGLLARHLCERVALVDRVHVGALLRQDWSGARVSVQTECEIVEPIEPLAYSSGEWLPCTAREIDFHGEWGKRRCYPFHLEELEAVVAAYPQLREAGYWLAQPSRFAEWVSAPLKTIATRIGPRAAAWAGRVHNAGLRLFDRPPHGTIVRAVAHIRGRNTAPVVVQLLHPDGYAHTAAVVVACLRQMIDGSRWRPGLHRMADFVDTTRALADIARLGVQVTDDPTITWERDPRTAHHRGRS